MISDKEKLLEELLRALKANGILFATVKHLNPPKYELLYNGKIVHVS